MSAGNGFLRIDDEIGHLIQMVRDHAPLEQILRHRCPACHGQLKIVFENAGLDFRFECRGNVLHFTLPHRTTSPPSWWKSCFEEWVETTYYYLSSAGIEPDGSLAIRTSTYGYAYHASGVAFIAPEDPDFAYWEWCVESLPHKKRFYDEEELAELRDQYIALFPNAPPPRHIAPRKQFDNASAICARCRKSFSTETMSPADFSVLEAQHEFQSFSIEYDWLLRVADFDRRHPNCKERIRPAYVDLLLPGKRVERARFLAEKTLSEYDLSVLDLPAADCDWTEEDLSVISYLQHQSFSLSDRFEIVTDKINELRVCVENWDVRCPECGGHLEWVVVD